MPNRADYRAVGEFAAARHGVFNMSQAAEHDLTRRQVAAMERSGIIVPVRQLVWRFAAHPVTPRQALYAATLGVRAVAARRSAAALHGSDGFERWPRLPEILGHHGCPVRLPNVVAHRTRLLTPADVTVVDHIPCTTLARTACDLAPSLTRVELIRLVDDIQRRGASMTWLMQRAIDLGRPGRSGPHEVLDIVRRRINGYRVPDTWFERLLSDCLTSDILVEVTRQHVLCDARGEFVARFDLAVPWARLGIEGHSRGYHVGELAERYDEDRDLRAAKEGWEICYLGFAATRAPQAVRRDIEEIVLRRAGDLGLTPPCRRQRPRSA